MLLSRVLAYCQQGRGMIIDLNCRHDCSLVTRHIATYARIRQQIFFGQKKGPTNVIVCSRQGSYFYFIFYMKYC